MGPVRRGGDDGACFEKGRAGELGNWAVYVKRV
jgi:hypothetical protein